MTGAAALAVLVAAAFDRFLVEPPERIHPVVWLGAIVDALDDRVPDSRAFGVLIALGLPIGFGFVGAVVVFAGAAGTERAVHATALGVDIDPQLAALGVGTVLAGLVLFSCSSLRLLTVLAVDVADRTETDLTGAREAVRGLVGRDATTLSAGQIRSAAAESAAENLADGLIAPLLAFVVATFLIVSAGVYSLVLPLAAGSAAWVKGVNTLDSMLGYRTRPIGWGAARLDDLVMWVPARASAVLLGVATGHLTAPIVARRWAHTPPSPNSGWPMATLAVALGVRFEKPSVYVLNPNAPLPDRPVALAGVESVTRAGWIGFFFASGLCLLAGRWMLAGSLSVDLFGVVAAL